MGRGGALALSLLAWLSAGCGGDSAPADSPGPVLTAATLGAQTVLTNAEYLALPDYAGADPGRGERQAQICRACHTLEAGGQNMIGPNLHGFFGSKAGTHAGFDYSPALRDADFVWTPRALDAWLAAPAHFLPGNRMTFPGVANASDRADLIAYLLATTGSAGQD